MDILRLVVKAEAKDVQGLRTALRRLAGALDGGNVPAEQELRGCVDAGIACDMDGHKYVLGAWVRTIVVPEGDEFKIDSSGLEDRE